MNSRVFELPFSKGKVMPIKPLYFLLESCGKVEIELSIGINNPLCPLVSVLNGDADMVPSVGHSKRRATSKILNP